MHVDTGACLVSFIVYKMKYHFAKESKVVMIQYPKLKRHYHPVATNEEVFLLTETSSLVLHGQLYCLVIPLLTGKLHINEIVMQLKDQAAPAEVFYVLSLLEQGGYIVENHDSLDDLDPFWYALHADIDIIRQRLRDGSIATMALGEVSEDLFAQSLESLGIQVSSAGDLLVVLVDDYQQLELEKLNRQALASSRPWMLVKPVGTRPWLGPIFRPGKTGCWKCLEQRLVGNRPVETFLQQTQGRSEPLPTSRSRLPTNYQAVINLAVTEVAKWLALGANERLEGALVTLNTLTLSLERHVLVKRPQCPACGELDTLTIREPAPVNLHSRRKVFTSDGGHRQVRPEDVVEQYKHHISPITGVVKVLQSMPTNSNGLVNNYDAGPNIAIQNNDSLLLEDIMRSHSGGKGKSAIQAQASGLGEAIERYCAVYQGYEKSVKGTYISLKPKAIHPNACMNFSSAQYAQREKFNKDHSKIFFTVPYPFDETTNVAWSPVWSLTHNEFKYLPMSYCYFGFSEGSEDRFFYPDSNGNAAGSSLEEAILQGLFELVERDSVGIWWFNRLQRPMVNLSSFREPYFEQLLAFYNSCDRELWVLDITTDLGIPSFAAVSQSKNLSKRDIIFGFGTHFDPTVAISRALTELNQLFPTVDPAFGNSNTTKAVYRTNDKAMIDWLTTATLENQPYLAPNTARAKVAGDYPMILNDDIKDDVERGVQIMAEHGMETLVLDMTRPDIGLSVVKVFVPGLCHFWNRLGARRLYEVPVQMGWLSQPLKEEQLNPTPVFI